MFKSNFVSPKIIDKFPDYACALITITGIEGSASDARSEKLLLEAESVTRNLLSEVSVDELSEVKAWREAYGSFGVKPRVARASFEALMRRIDKGLPRIDLLTDIYNAVSVIYRVPIGGENLDRYVGSPRLEFAVGDEKFETRENGETVIQNVEPGEVICRDDLGVTCRRWNWRQCIRTRIDHETKTLLFIVEALGPDSILQVHEAGSRLLLELRNIWPDLSAEMRVEHNQQNLHH